MFRDVTNAGFFKFPLVESNRRFDSDPRLQSELPLQQGLKSTRCPNGHLNKPHFSNPSLSALNAGTIGDGFIYRWESPRADGLIGFQPFFLVRFPPGRVL